MKKVTQLVTIIFALAFFAGCGGNSTTVAPGKQPIDPSGNWTMKFSDASNNSFLLSALFSQTGSVVTALNILAAGNPAPFSCVPFSGSFANGEVLNVDQFSGDVNTSFGNIHFSSTLNAQGSHSSGTYTLTGSCWGVAGSGTFTADEIPSVSGSWTGTITCQTNCPVGSTSGTISASLTQNDSTGAVSGTYTTTGLPNLTSGTLSTGTSDLLSGASWQDTVKDNNSIVYVIAGGPFNGSPGLGLDRSFNGLIVGTTGSNATYSVTMTH
jgi:hypothetical protein